MTTESTSARGITSEPIAGSRPVEVSLELDQIRTDGETQCRASLNEYTVRDYQTKMEAGVVFPPVKVWWDGKDYWLADGFQRLAAAKRAGLARILSEVRNGTCSDARWESYACNAAHGLPRTKSDAQTALLRALAHPNSSRLSTAELARYLQLPEPTVRRWRNRQTAGQGEQVLRTVKRNGTTYFMNVVGIGRSGSRSRPKAKSIKDLDLGLKEMKLRASPEVRVLLNVFANWALGASSHWDCLKAIESIGDRWKRPQGTSSAPGGAF